MSFTCFVLIAFFWRICFRFTFSVTVSALSFWTYKLVRIYIDGDIEVGCSLTTIFAQGQDFVIVPSVFRVLSGLHTWLSSKIFCKNVRKNLAPPFLLTNCSSYTLALKSICAGILITSTVSKGFPTPTLWEQWIHAATPSTFSLSMNKKNSH